MPIALHLDDLDTNLDTRLARAAHELNAPLSLIRGSLDNLADNFAALVRGAAAQTEGESVEHLVASTSGLLQICRESTEHLTHIVAELRAHAGGPRESQSMVPVDLRGVIEQAIRLATQSRRHDATFSDSHPETDLPDPRECSGRAARAARAGEPPALPMEEGPELPRFECALPPDLPPVWGRRAALVQVFANLLANAVDAVSRRREPGVWIEACMPHGENAPCVEVRVRDNGSGVPAALRERIFEDFFSTKPRERGLGLGLAIARDLLRRLGGTLELAPAPSAGSEFVVRLRSAAPARL